MNEPMYASKSVDLPFLKNSLQTGEFHVRIY